MVSKNSDNFLVEWARGVVRGKLLPQDEKALRELWAGYNKYRTNRDGVMESIEQMFGTKIQKQDLVKLRNMIS